VSDPWDVAGPSDGEPILFLHGAVMTRAQWWSQVESLAAAGYRCIAVDLPAHGSLEGAPFSIEAAEDLVIDAIDRAAGGRAVLVGLSLGGYVAMAVAARSPERVRGLVLAGASREPAGAIRFGYVLFAWALRVIPERALRRLIAALYRRRYGPEAAEATLAKGYFATGGSQAIRHLPGGRFRDRLAAFGGPILVINGTRDVVFRTGQRRFIEGLPGLTTRLLPGAGHLSNLDRSADFSEAVGAFVAGLAS
jgi:pimeloyl-ACP methyl ester carboxylesterase